MLKLSNNHINDRFFSRYRSFGISVGESTRVFIITQLGLAAFYMDQSGMKEMRDGQQEKPLFKINYNFKKAATGCCS